MKKLNSKNILILIAIVGACSLPIFAQPNIPKPKINPPQVKSVSDLLRDFFNDLGSRVIADADKLNQWKNDAVKAAAKTTTDFTDCPSPAAQNVYDDLKTKRDKAVAVKAAAETADRQADEARNNCKRTTHLDAQCDSAYNSLAFKATAGAAADTIAGLDAAITVMKNLKCPSGCNHTARLIYPTVSLTTQLVSVRDLMRVPLPGSSATLPYVTELTYCSAWSPGEFSANWDTGNGEFDAGVRGKLPMCKKTESISCCSEWKLELVLPELKRLNLVPASLAVSDLEVTIPTKSIEVVSGVQEASCTQKVKICKRSTMTLSLLPTSSAYPLSVDHCDEWMDVACAAPVFGIAPVYKTEQVPDITKVKFSWKGAAFKPGSVTVDMTKPEFKATCSKGCPSSVSVPNVNFGKAALDLPWVCLEPRFVNVVGRR